MRFKFETILAIICAIFFLASFVKANEVASVKKPKKKALVEKSSKPISSQDSKLNKFVGDWVFERTRNGVYLSLAVTIKKKDGKLTGDYSNVSSKQSFGNILSARLAGNSAILEIDCDWGGSGTVKITPIGKDRLRWQVIKRNEKEGEFIVLINQVLKRQKKRDGKVIL